MALLPPVPFKEKLISGLGYLTPAWADWFNRAFVRMGGSDALTNVELDDEIDELAEDVAGLSDELGEFETVRSVIATDSPTVDDDVLICSGASFTITLFASLNNSGKRLTIMHNGTSITQVYTIDGNLSETVGGAATTAIHTNGETVVLICDGSNWHILDRRIPSVWASTPTPSATPSNSTRNNYFWRRVGDAVEVQLGLTATGAASADWLTMAADKWIPNGASIDSAKLGVYLAGAETDRASVGTYIAQDAGTDRFNATVHIDTSGNITPSSASGGSFPFTVASGDGLSIRISVPVSGWNG